MSHITMYPQLTTPDIELIIKRIDNAGELDYSPVETIIKLTRLPNQGEYYIGACGIKFYFDVLRDTIMSFSELEYIKNHHVFVQLDVLGLFNDFNKGCSPFSLPRTFG